MGNEHRSADTGILLLIVQLNPQRAFVNEDDLILLKMFVSWNFVPGRHLLGSDNQQVRAGGDWVT